MTSFGRIFFGLLMIAAIVGCDSVELTIAVAPGSGGMLEVRNADTAAWHGARLTVEAVETDGSTVVCAERSVEDWSPGEAVTVPDCGDKVRLTLTTGGETARFVWTNGELFRKLGRKEIPMGSS